MTELSPIGPTSPDVQLGRASTQLNALATRFTGASVSSASDLGTKFEAAMLTPLMTSILPPDDSAIWGGSAGKLWRGLFAEQLAHATAQSGGIGIGDVIEQAIEATAGGK